MDGSAILVPQAPTILRLTDYGVDKLNRMWAERPLEVPGFGIIDKLTDGVMQMAGFSTYLARAVLNDLFRGVPYSPPGTMYIGLNASDPTDAGTATELAIGTGSYARAGVSSTTGNWTAPATVSATEQITNATNVTFPTPTADWNTGNAQIAAHAVIALNQDTDGVASLFRRQLPRRGPDPALETVAHHPGAAANRAFLWHAARGRAQGRRHVLRFHVEAVDVVESSVVGFGHDRQPPRLH